MKAVANRRLGISSARRLSQALILNEHKQLYKTRSFGRIPLYQPPRTLSLLALLHKPAESAPCAKAGDVADVWLLRSDKHYIAETVAVEAADGLEINRKRFTVTCVERSDELRLLRRPSEPAAVIGQVNSMTSSASQVDRVLEVVNRGLSRFKTVSEQFRNNGRWD